MSCRLNNDGQSTATESHVTESKTPYSLYNALADFNKKSL